MSRRSRALSAAAVCAAVGGAVGVPALTSAQTTGGHDVTVRDRVKAVKFVHTSRARGERLAMGDRVITSQATFDEQNKPVGSLTTDCVNVGRTARVFDATLQCSSIYRFGNGQVVTSGVVRLGGNPASIRIAIVGGSGAYRSAKGEVSAGAPVNGYDNVDALHLDG